MPRNIITQTALFLAALFVTAPVSAMEYDSMGRRDPFVPLVGVPEETVNTGVWGIMSIEDVSLQGIVIDPDGSRSIIVNGQIMKQGQRVGRLSIKEIGDNEVTVQIDEQEHRMKLYE